VGFREFFTGDGSRICLGHLVAQLAESATVKLRTPEGALAILVGVTLRRKPAICQKFHARPKGDTAPQTCCSWTT
jgi:hypothetical protein